MDSYITKKEDQINFLSQNPCQKYKDRQIKRRDKRKRIEDSAFRADEAALLELSKNYKITKMMSGKFINNSSVVEDLNQPLDIEIDTKT